MDESQPEVAEKLAASETSTTTPSSAKAEAGPSSPDRSYTYPVWGFAIGVAVLALYADVVVEYGQFAAPLAFGLALLLIASPTVMERILRKTGRQPSTAIHVYTVVVYAVCCAGMSFLGLGWYVAWSFHPDPSWPWAIVSLSLCAFGVVGAVVFIIRLALLVIRLLRTRSSRRVS